MRTQRPPGDLIKALRKVLKPVKGIKVSITAGGVTISSDDLKRSPSSETLDLSNACARRHHPECRYDKCVCACHQKGDSVNG